MTYSLDGKQFTGEDSPAGRAGWTEREQALLAARDARHAVSDVDDEMFARNVIDRCEQLFKLPLDQIADDDEIAARMASEADSELRTGGRQRAEQNADAIREIAERNNDYLQAIALRMSGRRDVAEDLVQETLERALAHFDQFEPGTEPRAWLTRILSNLYLDYLRHEAVVMKAAPKLAVEEAIESDLDRGFLSIPPDTLWNAVRALDPDLRQIIELRYRDDLSFKAIAQLLRVPIGTVGSRLTRALNRLLQQLRRRAA